MADEKPPARSTEQRIADLELQLAQTQAGLPGGTIPEHAAGFGSDVEQTWSQQEQEAAYAEANDLAPHLHPLKMHGPK